MRNVEVITQQVDEWEKIATSELPQTRSGRIGRERIINTTTAGPFTISQHLIPMQQELYRLREALAASAALHKKVLKDKDTVDAIDKIRNF